jgi:hypothetical protein
VRKLLTLLFFEAVILLVLIPLFSMYTGRNAIAQTSFPDPANEHACPSQTGAGGGAEAIPAFIGPGIDGFSPNQSLCLPQLAPVPSGASPLAFIVKGDEPGIRVDSQGTVYVESIRGVPGGIDLWRWSPMPGIDGAPNANGTLPFKYEGQPDNCGIFGLNGGGCVNNVGSPTNLGVAPGGGDADIAVNTPDPNNSAIPNVAMTSLTLAPGVTATNSGNRGDVFFTPPNVVAALVPGDDRMWNDAVNDPSTVYVAYHDLATFNINVQRSNNGGLTYTAGAGEAIDVATLPAAGSLAPTDSANTAAQIKVDHSACPSKGNLYVAFTAPDNAAENTNGGPQRTIYVGVSTDAGLGAATFTFTDHKVFTSPAGSLGATQGTNNIFPALAVDSLGNVYTVWSDNQSIFLSSSSDLGNTWTAPVRVNSDGTVGKSNVFPWVAADANGHVVVTWLGANLAGNSNDVATMQPTCADGTTDCWAQWNVYAAESVNGNAAVPTFTQHVASDHVIHSGTVCTSGTGCSNGDSRSLADFFQVALDPQHRANIAYADDHLASPLCSQQSPGHCANNDPQAFRVAVPYFTYQLKPNKKVVTTGLCAR